MVRVAFTRSLERFLPCPPREVSGETVREALDGVFATNPRLKPYVLDEQGRLRKNVSVFVEGELVSDRERLSDRVADGTEIFVMQSLAGG